MLPAEEFHKLLPHVRKPYDRGVFGFTGARLGAYNGGNATNKLEPEAVERGPVAIAVFGSAPGSSSPNCGIWLRGTATLRMHSLCDSR